LCTVLAVLTLAFPVSSSAGEIHVEWDAVPGALGYRIYYGTESGVYTHSLTVGLQSAAVVQGLSDCTTWYLAVKAFNSGGESVEFSNEVSGWPRPMIQAIAPSVATQGGQFTMNLHGANYQAGAGLVLDDLALPRDVSGNPLFRIEAPTVLSCNQIQALVSIEPSTRGVRAMPVGDFSFGWEVRNPDSAFGVAHLGFEVQFDPSRWDINRSDATTMERVDGSDLSWLAYSFGSHEGGPLYYPDADLNGDGSVDGEDLAFLSAGFGRCWSGTAWTVDACS
jgi:hypothetical protein